MTGFIAVHVGAGKYSESSAPRFEKVCRLACRKGIEILKAGGSALDAVTEATVVLENSALTNTGHGSNLTIDGTVECDASVMDGFSLTYGAAGAVQCVRNPILLARKVCDRQNEELPLGRVAPCLLVGPGAVQFADECGIDIVHPSDLTSDNAFKIYKKTKRRLVKCEALSHNSIELCSRLDTVGAICLDSNGHTAAACSSGGILLKQSGRVGQAAAFGCGCWASDAVSDEDANIAVTTSGCGEYIVKTLLARELSIYLKTSKSLPSVAVSTAINELFLKSRFLNKIRQKFCGVLILKCDRNSGELLWAHTTPSMCIAYMSVNNNKPTSQMSRLPEGVEAGKCVTVQGVPIY